MSQKKSLPYSLPPLTTQKDTVRRWLISIFFSISILLLFLLIVIKSEPKVIEYPSPSISLDYIVLPPKKVKKIKKTKPRIKMKPPRIPKIVEIKKNIPSPKAKVAPSEQNPTVADIAASSVKAKKLVKEYIRIQNVTELDNTDFNPIYNPKPPYPAVAMKNNIEGFVDLDLIINEKGRVDKFSIIKVSGHPSFSIATAKTLPKWRFPPPRLKGKKIKIKYIYRINFTLD